MSIPYAINVNPTDQLDTEIRYTVDMSLVYDIETMLMWYLYLQYIERGLKKVILSLFAVLFTIALHM